MDPSVTYAYSGTCTVEFGTLDFYVDGVWDTSELYIKYFLVKLMGVSMCKLVRVGTTTLIVSLLYFFNLGARGQVYVGPTVKTVTAQERVKFLRGQDGLEKLTAKLQGNVELNDIGEPWGIDDLPSLVKRSDVVVVASVVGRTGYLSADGDEIYSDYVLEPDEALKGTASHPMTITARGGSAVLSNGHTATIHTALFDEIKVNEKYIFFVDGQSGTMVPLVTPHPVLRLNETDDKVEVNYDRLYPESQLARDLAGISVALVKQKIRDVLPSTP